MEGKSTIEIAKRQRHLHLLKKVRQVNKLSSNELRELEAFEENSSNENKSIHSQADAARYCGVTIRTIRIKEKDYPLKDGRGNYIPEMLDRYVKAVGAEPSSLKEKTLFADLELKGKKSELAQWELDLRAGKYVLAEEVEQQSIAKIAECRRAMLAMPRRLSAKLEHKTRAEIQEILQTEVAYMLDVFAGQKVTPPHDPVVETMEYYYLLDKKDRGRLKEMICKRNIKNQKSNCKTTEQNSNIKNKTQSGPVMQPFENDPDAQENENYIDHN